MMGNSSNAQAKIEQSVKIPDYFSCHNCMAQPFRSLVRNGKQIQVNECEEFQAAGRCAKVMLAQAIQAGQVQIVLHLEGVTR